MSKTTPMRMPELLVYGRAAVYGAVLAEVGRLAFYGSLTLGESSSGRVSPSVGVVLLLACFALMAAYGWRRGAFSQLGKVAASRRIDLLAACAVGVWASSLLSPQLANLHAAAKKLDPSWSLLLLSLFLLIMSAAVVRDLLARSAKPQGQDLFLSDDEIGEEDQDLLGVAEQAREFAETVIAVGAQPGLVFGLDAPWGTGKTSFLNLAERVWDRSESTVVVKFQALRYASEPDLSDRFIRELCSAIKQQAFAPEFAPAADRYSRMLKGKTDLSFLGFKLSLEQSNETIDELLEDIDAVLKQSSKRLVVIVEDLDRLEPKLVNNVLFTIRRTFRLTQAAYILCFDAEMLVAGQEEGARAREFLEKFITVKLSLFVDSKALKDFLATDWKNDASRFPLVPADAMFSLGQVMHAVGEMVGGEHSHSYAPLLGDLRKLKRLLNAMLMMRLEKFDLGRSDFDPRDLVHLVLLHLRNPGLFRQIYAEETEGRTGTFSLKRGEDPSTSNLQNSEGFAPLLATLDPTARFLVTQLFDVNTLDFSRFNQPDEGVLRTRACFNRGSRNLENYLKLIVRFTAPADVDTFRLYKEAVEAVISGSKTVKDVLTSEKFSLRHGQLAQDQFWRVLLSKSFELQPVQAAEAIDELVKALPNYSASEIEDRSLRTRSVYSLATLLDRVGYGVPRNGRIRDNTDVRDIAKKLLGDPSVAGPSIVERLAAPDRGALGWNDLMMFRLVCSIDRQGSLSNVYRGLLQYEDPSANGGGEVPLLALNSLRRLSQNIFRLFKSTFILRRISFYAAVDAVTDEKIFASIERPSGEGGRFDSPAVVRSTVKSFVIFQLANEQRGHGSGVGCGVYDEDGTADRGGIRAAMAQYLLGFCFDPSLGHEHAIAFGDFCVRSVRETAILTMGEASASAIETVLTQVLPRESLAVFWERNGSVLRTNLLELDREIESYSYKATYKDKLPLVFGVLDNMATPNVEGDEQPPSPDGDAINDG